MRNTNFANGFSFVNQKSLDEQIEDVKKSNATRAEKISSLLALGLLEREALLVLRLPSTTTVRIPRHIFTYTFGVEIECINAPRPNLLEAVTAKGVGIFTQVYDYNAHRDHMTHYKVISDSSLYGANANEVVSPVLKSSNGFASLKKVTEALSEIGATVNKSCGLHVHIGAADLTEEQYCNVFKNYYQLQALIDSFLAPSRRDAYYAKHLTHRIMDCHTRREVMLSHSNRYWVVNHCAYDRHQTIEFRQHQGSTNFTKIQNWVKFCAKLVEWSKDNVLTAAPASIDEIPFLTATEKRYFKSRQAAFMREAA